MISRLNRIVPAFVCVASAALIVGCNGEAETTAETQTASASGGVQAAQAESDDNNDRATRSTENRQLRTAEAEDRDRETSREARERRIAEARAEREGRDREPTSREASSDRERETIIQAEPTLLDLGEMGTRERRSGTVTLRNVGERPMKIEGSRTDCGCTVANVPEGQYIEPGESVDVEVSLRGGAREQTLRKNVTFMFSEQPNLRVQVVGHVKSFVSVDPQRIHPDRLPDGRLVIRSDDGEPFRVLAVHPQIAEIASDEAATEQEVFIDWGVWEDQRQPRRVRFDLDHPKAQQISANILVPRRDPVATEHSAERPERLSTRAQVQKALEDDDVDGLETLIVDEGADIEITDSTGLTLLGIAARHGKIDMMQMLLKHGADVNAADRVGRTPLMAAGQAGKPDAVRVLLDAGADVNARDNTLGGTALAWTAGFGDSESLALLLDAGAEVDAVGEATGFTPLIWAAGFGEDESVRLLIDAGADVEAVDFTQEMTPTIHAARRGSADAIKMLAEAGADIERPDATGRNPLLWAAGSNDATVDVIDALIELGADVEATDRHGQNALDHASGRTDEHAAAVIRRLEELLGTNDNADSDENDGASNEEN